MSGRSLLKETSPLLFYESSTEGIAIVNIEIHTAIVAHIAEACKNAIKYQFDAMLSKFGPTMGKAWNDYEFARIWRESVRPACDVTQVDRLHPNLNTYSLSEVRLDAIARRHAEAAADEVIAKVTAKVGELKNGELAYLGGASFRINGNKGAHKVLIEQSQIINVSSKGHLFNQWPARIYVDGKLTAAAAFGKIDSGAEAAGQDAVPVPNGLAVEWKAKPATCAHSGTIKAISETEVIQCIGRGQHVVWQRSIISGAEIELNKMADIDANGCVKAPRQKPKGLSL